MISEFVQKIKDGKIKVVVDKTPYRCKYHMYGSIKGLDKLVDSTKVSDRVKAARMGYGLEKLKDDTSSQVQKILSKYQRI